MSDNKTTTAVEADVQRFVNKWALGKTLNSASRLEADVRNLLAAVQAQPIKLLEQVKQLRDALELLNGFACHDIECQAMTGLPSATDEQCDCGYSKAVEKMRTALALSEENETSLWRPMETAPRDGTPVLLLVKSEEALPERCNSFANIAFVGRTRLEWGLDAGWNFAAPVGHGGIPDRWLVGWMSLPPVEAGDAA